MITERDILTEINKLLVEKYADVTMYVNLCPKDFDRPSFYIEHTTTNRRDINCKTIEVTAYYSITCYISVDKHHNIDADALLDRQTEVMDIFRSGYITIDDRAIKIKANSGGTNTGEAYIDLQFEYWDDRSAAVDDTDLIQTITANTTIKEG